MIPCGECKGTTYYKVNKTKVPCPICNGSGESIQVMDSSGKIPILPGELARILPTVIGHKDNGEEIYSAGYKGEVRHVMHTSKGTIVVTIQALPSLSSAGQSTHNHGMRSTRPEYIKMLKSNANLKRLEKYKEKKAALKAEEDSCQV